MKLSLDYIESEMIAGHATVPGLIADWRSWLAASISLATAKLDRILDQKSTIWLGLRDKVNSDKAADRRWDATELGTQERHLRSEMKRMDALNKALGSKLRIAEMEARNQM